MKKYLILTSVLALTACGGGSGGGHGNGIPSEMATTGVFAATHVNSDTGLGMIDINQTRISRYAVAKTMAQLIENESNIDSDALIARSATVARSAITPAQDTTPTPEEVDHAYEIMSDILLGGNIEGYTNHDILLSLALVFVDKDQILDVLQYNSGDDIDGKIQDLVTDLTSETPTIGTREIVNNAREIYQDFGSSFELTLTNAKFYHNSNDTNFYTFKFDDNGNITHIAEQDGRLYAKNANGVFENDVVRGKCYTFEHSDEANGHEFHVNVDVVYDTEQNNIGDVRAALIQQVAQQYGVPEPELTAASNWINNADIIHYGEDCENVNGCIEISNANHKEKIRIETGSKDLGLKYSDFGLRYEEVELFEGDDEIADIGLDYYHYKEHGGFVGGYEDKKATPESGMRFSGHSYVGLTRKLSDAEIDEIIEAGGSFPYPDNVYYKGDSTLTVSGTGGNLQQHLVADFSKAGWYTVSVDNMPLNGHEGTFSFENNSGKSIDDKWQVRPDTHDGKMENMNIKYYGPESDNATEVVGFVQYIEDKKDSDDWTFKADITFGAKKDIGLE